MTGLFYRRPNSLLASLPLSIVAFAFGCEQAEQIRSYTVPKEVEAPPVASATPAEIGEPTDRMLVAILPVGDRAYFFKVVGPIAAVGKHADEIMNFFASVRVGQGQPTPDWKPAERWTVKLGTGMRVATITIPTDNKPLEMAVTTLPWTGGQDDVLLNVNRWRGQLQLAQVGAQELPKITRDIKVGDATMTIVDLRGRFAGSGMTPPFAGGPVGDASQSAPNSAVELPLGHPPIDATADSQGSAPAASVASTGLPKFDAPNTWRPQPPAGMRKAVFAIGSEEQDAIVTLIDFPANAGPMIADPLENVNRWRREVGLPDIENDQLADSIESIEIDGKAASYVRLVPDPSKPQESRSDRATLAAMVNTGEVIWFIKLIGNRDLVADQEDEFKTFLKSVRFAADGGAPDGNR